MLQTCWHPSLQHLCSSGRLPKLPQAELNLSQTCNADSHGMTQLKSYHNKAPPVPRLHHPLQCVHGSAASSLGSSAAGSISCMSNACTVHSTSLQLMAAHADILSLHVRRAHQPRRDCAEMAIEHVLASG